MIGYDEFFEAVVPPAEAGEEAADRAFAPYLYQQLLAKEPWPDMLDIPTMSRALPNGLRPPVPPLAEGVHALCVQGIEKLDGYNHEMMPNDLEYHNAMALARLCHVESIMP